MLHDRHLYLVLECFHPSAPIGSHCALPCPSRPGSHSCVSVSTGLLFLEVSREWSGAAGKLLCLAPSTQRDVFGFIPVTACVVPPERQMTGRRAGRARPFLLHVCSEERGGSSLQPAVEFSSISPTRPCVRGSSQIQGPRRGITGRRSLFCWGVCPPPGLSDTTEGSPGKMGPPHECTTLACSGYF